MKKAKLSAREAIMVVFLVVLLVAVVYYMFFLTPLKEELASIDVEIAKVETQIESFQEDLQEMDYMQKVVDEKKAIPEDQRTEVAPYDNLVDVLAALDEYLYANSKSYKLTFPDPEVAEDGTVRRVVEMEFECSNYEAARAMVDDLTGNKWRCLVSETLISAADEGATDIESSTVEVKLTVTFFELSEYAA